jgi:TonB-dependent starch-binding outer membrane protein SusC
MHCKLTKCFCLSKSLALFFAFIIFSLQTHAQNQRNIAGKVTDSKDGTALSGISVSVKGTRYGSTTGNDGLFLIKLPSSEGSVTLVFSSTGYDKKEVTYQGQTDLSVSLKSTSVNLNEVTVIGYGSRKKKDITGAVSTVSSKDIEKSTAMTPELALQGRAPGVFIESGGGSPSARPSIRIRGTNTFGFAEPLYVIDGLPVFEGGAGITGGAVGDIRSPINIFTLVNPADIESMTVLKDASAAAIYGVRASNGVILITTKRGKAGKAKLEVNATYGLQKLPNKLSVLNTQQYFSLLQEAYAANPDANTSFAQKFGPLYDASSPQYVGNSPSYDWDGALRNDKAIMSDVTAKVSGGSEATTYYFSAGYTKTESPLKAEDLERFTVAANIDAKISKHFSTGLNLRLIRQTSLNNTNGSIIDMMSTVPFQKINDANDPTGFAASAAGTFKDNPDYDPTLLNPGPFKIFDGDPQLLWGAGTRYNPFALQALTNNRYEMISALGNAFIQFEPLAGLKLKAVVGGNFTSNLRKNYSLFDSWRFSQTPNNPWNNLDPIAKGTIGRRETKTYNLNKELVLTYDKIINSHTFNIVLSASDQYGKWDVDDKSGNIFFDDPNLHSIRNQPPYTQGFYNLMSEDALIGYMGRLSYNYKSKYYIDGTLRRDGSSRLAPGYKWDNFPSIGLAWRISAEKFFPKWDFVNDLKLRGGWGRLGNFQSAGAYSYLSQVNNNPDYAFGSGNGNALGNNNIGIRLPNFANTTLTWEKVKTTSFGFDAVLFSNLNFSAEYYNKTTFDIIQSVGLPPNTGIEFPADLNVATVNNKGFEFQAGYNKSFGKVNFNAQANLTTVKNNVIKLNGGSPIGGELGRIEEGYSMFYLWGYKAGGVFQSQQQIDAWKASVPNGDANIGAYGYQPGDLYFQDVNGSPINGGKVRNGLPDSVVNSDDRTYLGKTIPGFYYGFSVGADWKGFDISLFFQGVGDVQRYNFTRASLEGMSGITNLSATVLNRWSATNPSSTIPRAIYNDPALFNRISSRYVENANYLRLKNVQIGYRMPSKLMEKLKVAQSMRFYVSAVNLFTITPWTGLDPENDGFPPTKQLLFGINVAF